MKSSGTTQVDAFRLIDFAMAVMDALDLQYGDCSNSALMPVRRNRLKLARFGACLSRTPQGTQQLNCRIIELKRACSYQQQSQARGRDTA